jgi:hypothetical protein
VTVITAASASAVGMPPMIITVIAVGVIGT